ncbi:hypothetical protein AVEN_165919-1 [Araneus ventricosus]|uniref:RNase H type-1 domain-containing protein n=1 Tax=Araneus ventricosus TaxID=182803 RepID=A0A4Y2WX18_ARAVE|nr:hypothetical protein AVEN_165919-1 [Araneus ventricosus]
MRATFIIIQKKVHKTIIINPFQLIEAKKVSSLKLSEIPLESRVLNIESQVPGSRFEVYTDGSKSDSEAGFAVCILEHGEPYEIFKFKLGVNNTVFQAEMAAKDFAVRWSLEKMSKLILLQIVNHPSRSSGAPGLRWSSGQRKF